MKLNHTCISQLTTLVGQGFLSHSSYFNSDSENVYSSAHGKRESHQNHRCKNTKNLKTNNKTIKLWKTNQ